MRCVKTETVQPPLPLNFFSIGIDALQNHIQTALRYAHRVRLAITVSPKVIRE